MRKLLLVLIAFVLVGCVAEDESPPTLLVESGDVIYHEINTEFTGLNFDVVDMEDENAYAVVKGEVDTTTLGDYEMVIFAEDSSGNKSQEISRIIRVVDTTPPIINEDNLTFKLEVFDEFVEPNIEVKDNSEGSIETSFVGSVDMNKTGVYEAIFTARDLSGNESFASVLLEVVDTIPPQLVNYEEHFLAYSFGDTFELPVICRDNYDGDLEPELLHEFVASNPGHYDISYYCSDSSGNTSETFTSVVEVRNYDLSQIQELKEVKPDTIFEFRLEGFFQVDINEVISMYGSLSGRYELVNETSNYSSKIRFRSSEPMKLNEEVTINFLKGFSEYIEEDFEGHHFKFRVSDQDVVGDNYVEIVLENNIQGFNIINSDLDKDGDIDFLQGGGQYTTLYTNQNGIFTSTDISSSFGNSQTESVIILNVDDFGGNDNAGYLTYVEGRQYFDIYRRNGVFYNREEVNPGVDILEDYHFSLPSVLDYNFDGMQDIIVLDREDESIKAVIIDAEGSEVIELYTGIDSLVFKTMDFDFDGDYDFVYIENFKLKLLENTEDGFLKRTLVDTSLTNPDIIIADLDGDFSMDIIEFGRSIYWSKDIDGIYNRVEVKDNNVYYTHTTADIDNDGLLEVIYTGRQAYNGDNSNNISVLDFSNNSFEDSVLLENVGFSNGIYIYDYNDDGKLDILTLQTNNVKTILYQAN